MVRDPSRARRSADSLASSRSSRQAARLSAATCLSPHTGPSLPPDRSASTATCSKVATARPGGVIPYQGLLGFESRHVLVDSRRLVRETLAVMRRCLLVVLLLSTVLTACSSPARNLPVKPRLVLVLSIDQMRFDYLTRFGPLYKGGLRMLLDRGAVFTNANYRQFRD